MNPTPTPRRALLWLRRDLRLTDHAALAAALAGHDAVFVAFVFDTDILAPLPRHDRRVAFIHGSLTALHADLQRLADRADVGLIVRHGCAVDEIAALAQLLGVATVFASHDDEPAARARDDAVRTQLARARIDLRTVKDHVVFERSELLTRTGTPYTVFTPYWRAWRVQLAESAWQPHDTDGLARALTPPPSGIAVGIPPLAALGFAPPPDDPRAALPTPGEAGAAQALAEFLPRLPRYHATRDEPALDSTSRLGVHLRFGTVSVRALVRTALAAQPSAQPGEKTGTETWLAELCWRDFFAQIMAHHPRAMSGAFRPRYDALRWEAGAQADAHFAAWCQGRTGYPLVDAAMRQLNTSGFMHNRLRMVASSFLVKHLGLDWRRGEAYFAEKLDDFDLASNNGNWQWAASTGCDAQPWFRVFNPMLQARKFDPQARFIRHWLPELAHLPDAALHDLTALSPLERATLPADYLDAPIVHHAAARERTLARYGAIKEESERSSGDIAH